MRTVNTAMVAAAWGIGREIVEHEQQGEARAAYGERLLQRLSERLTAAVGTGYSVPNLRRMRQFYLSFPRGSALQDGHGPPPGSIRSAPLSESSPAVVAHFPPALGWTHYQALLRVTDPAARRFYEIEAARESWSARELERQIASLLYERLAISRDPEQVRALAREGQRVSRPQDVMKEPVVLEFLGLREQPAWHERDLERAILNHLESFLLELGKGFCFVARQRRITIDGDHFYIDLVFYNRLLRCFVLVDLKVGKLTHQDLGQMQMYVNFYDRTQREPYEEPTVGIVLCSDKNDAMVRITLPEDNQQILASRYQLYLPTEEELRMALLEQQREEGRLED